MKIHLENFDCFRDFISMLYAINEEQTLIVTDTGIHTRCMDNDHTTMIDARINIAGGSIRLDDFTEETEKINLNMGELSKRLARFGKNDEVDLHYDPERARVVLEKDKRGSLRRFELPVLEPLDYEVPQPKIVFKSKIQLDIDALILAVKDANLVGEFIVFDAKEKLFTIKSDGDYGSTFNEWAPESDDIISFTVEEEHNSTFTLDKLDTIVRASKPLAKRVQIELDQDMPVKLELQSTSPGVEATFYLAPCIGV